MVVNLLVNLFAVTLIYLLPGYAISLLVKLPHNSTVNRTFLSLCLSLVVVPYTFMVVGNLHNIIPNLPALVTFLGIILFFAWLLKKFNRRIALQFLTRDRNPILKTSLEGVVVWSLIFSYAAITNLPRLAMFLQGDSTLSVNPWDETWHLAQLISVARTGIPPQHYFFPTTPLAYYYGSWIYPAILGNLPDLNISLARAMAIHSFLITVAFLGLVYTLLSHNVKSSWGRLLGMLFFTILGGFDLYAQFPAINDVDWWVGKAYWLVPAAQISQFTTE